MLSRPPSLSLPLSLFLPLSLSIPLSLYQPLFLSPLSLYFPLYLSLPKSPPLPESDLSVEQGAGGEGTGCSAPARRRVPRETKQNSPLALSWLARTGPRFESRRGQTKPACFLKMNYEGRLGLLCSAYIIPF